MPKLNEIYRSDINRPIQNVIKIGENQEIIKQELEEYVVTREIRNHFNTFFSAYDKSINRDTDEIGVWISGFYGSGKSHLLKILSYLLENAKTTDGKYAVDYFESKIDDESLFGEIKRAGEIDSKVILFNIASVANIDTVTNKKDQILTVFEKTFNESIGLCTLPTCAAFERYLISNNKYEEFQEKYKEYTKLEWKKSRRTEFHRKDRIRKPYAEVMEISEDDAQRSLDEIDRTYYDNMSVDYFTNIVKEYIDKKGNNFHVVFLVDEIGQYMEEDTSLMLNLQTIVEDLGKKCNGKAWVIVTSQEDIDKYTKVKGADFSKILARFNTRLNLTSSDIKEVIKKRLLEKKNTNQEPYEQILANLYNENEITIRNLMEFKGGETQKIYSNAKEFAEFYPFIPYQFSILQKVFDNIRRFGYTGKSISRGERSLISSTQETAKKFTDDRIGCLVPFFAFYDSVERELDTKNIQTINNAKDKVGSQDGLEEVDISILELLFMLKNLKEVPANIENISTLFISSINDNKDTIKKTVVDSLRRLERQTLIQRNNDVYQFLTDEEQEINKAINGYHVQDSEIREYIANIIYGENYANRRYTLNKQTFDLAKFLDEKNYGFGEGKIGLKIFTDDIELNSQSAMDNAYAYIKLDLNLQTREEIKRSLRIHAFRQDKIGIANESERMTEILATKNAEEREINTRLKVVVQNLVKDAPIFVSGAEKDIKSKDIASRFEEVFATLIRNVYSKFDFIKTNYTTDNIRDLWNTQNVQISMAGQTYANPDAYSEVLEYCKRKTDSFNDLSINELVSYFASVPYGFLETDTEYIIALLLRNEKIILYSNNRALDNYADDTLTKIIRKDTQTIIKIRKEIEKNKVDVINNLSSQVFKEILPDDEDGMKRKFTEILRNKRDILNDKFNIHYNKKEKYEYPGKTTIQETIKLFEKIININDINDFFNIVFDEQDNIKNNMEKINNIFDFFEEQYKIFDKARDIVLYCQESKIYIDMIGENIELNKSINETKEILRKEEPYSEVPRLKELWNKISMKLIQLYDDVAEPIIEQVEETKKHIINEREKYNLKDDSNISKFIDTCDKTLNELRTSQKLGIVFAQKAVNESTRDKFDNYIIFKLNEQNQTQKEDEENNAKILKKEIVLNPSMLIKGKKYKIETEQDIDIYINDIRQALVEKLNNGDSIIIK